MKIKLLILAVMMAISTNSNAGDIVFDPSNFVKNTITAGQQVKQTALQVSINANEAKQLMLALQNVKNLDPAVIKNAVNRGLLPGGEYKSVNAAIDAAAGVYRTYKSAGTTMDGLLKVYSDIDTVNKELMRISTESKVSPERILQHEANQAAAGKALANSELQRLNELNGDLQYHQKRADALAKEIPATSGSLQMLQLVGSQNYLMSDQLTQLIQTTTSNAQAAQNEAYLKAEERERSAKIAKQAEERNTKLYAVDKK